MRSLLYFLVLGAAPLVIGISATLGSAFYTTTTVLHFPQCNEFRKLSEYGYPFFWMDSWTLLSADPNCTDFGGWLPTYWWQAFIVDMLFYAGVYYGLVLAFTGSRKLLRGHPPTGYDPVPTDNY